MTTTYDITTDIGKMRLTIGDKDVADAVFTDEELQVFLTASGSVLLGSATALEAWAATYAANANAEKIGDYSYTQKIIENMLKLATNLRATVNATPEMDWAELNLPLTSEEATA